MIISIYKHYFYKSLLDKITKKANIFIIHKNIESFNKLKNIIEGM